MTESDRPRARPHDLGGQPAGRVDPSDHDLEPWHRLVTGLLNALRDHPKGRVIKVDEMRRAIEDMPAEEYRKLEYFEKWAIGLSALMIEKNLASRAEIEQRMSKIRDGLRNEVPLGVRGA